MKKNVAKILKEMFDIDIKKYNKKVQLGLEDIEINHDFSWVRDLYEKNRKNLKKIALFYRGTKITYHELFESARKYAAILSKMGVNENSEIPICMSNSPEFIYTIMGANLLGAKVNIFGTFNPDYITEIINGCNSNFIICGDNQYPMIKESIDNSKVEQIVLFSLADSLLKGTDPYIEIDKPFYDFKNRVPEFKEKDSRIIDKKEFMSLAPETYLDIPDYDKGRIDTEFLVTYSSGSTNSNRPKAIVHTNRSLITMGRFQDPDLSSLPQMNDLIGLDLIPPHSNTGVITSMSDVLYKGCIVALEPIYKKEFFLYSLAINKPNYVSAPRNMIVYSAKQMYADPRFKGFKMPYMMMLTSVGEPTSLGEEKFINKMLRKANCGVAKLPRPISPVPLSIGGGDCERGGMFFTPYRSLQDLNPKFKLTGSRCGLKKYSMVQMAILGKDGKRLEPGNVGRLVVKTPTTMKKYKNNPKATEEFYIMDSEGEIWTDCNAYAFIDKYGTLEILERIGKEITLDDGSLFPLFNIGKEVEKDTKHILSYEVVNVDNKIVVHLEFMPGRKNNISNILMGIEKRIEKKFGPEILSRIVYRVRDFEEYFVGTSCEKRDYNLLVSEGISDKCVKPMNMNGYILMMPALEFFNGKAKVKTKTIS